MNQTRILETLFFRYPRLEPCADALKEVATAISDCFAAGGILYLCGNGGSFADAVHLKGELAKRFLQPRPLKDGAVLERLHQSVIGRELAGKLEQGFPVVVLGESHSLRSAFENDVDPVLHYAQELHSFAAHIRPGVFMGISTSGTARNVIAAATLAKALGLTCIAFTGPDGGELVKLCDFALKTPEGSNPSDIQEQQLPLYHALCAMVEAYCCV